jgi:hypothetical protein
LIIEVKTELLDLGAIERTMGWYEREAVAAARRLGWRPLRSASALLVLDSEANDRAIRAARDVLARAFAGRATALRRVVSGEDAVDGARFLSSIDPRSRRSVWLRTTTTDGRRTAAPYADYADALRHLSHGPARR